MLQWEYDIHPLVNLPIFSSHPLSRISWSHAYHSWPAAQPDETKKKQEANWSRRLMLLRPAGFLLLKVTYTAQTFFSLNMYARYVQCNVLRGTLNHSHCNITLSRTDNSFQSTLQAGARMIAIAISQVRTHTQ